MINVKPATKEQRETWHEMALDDEAKRRLGPQFNQGVILAYEAALVAAEREAADLRLQLATSEAGAAAMRDCLLDWQAAMEERDALQSRVTALEGELEIARGGERSLLEAARAANGRHDKSSHAANELRAQLAATKALLNRDALQACEVKP